MHSAAETRAVLVVGSEAELDAVARRLVAALPVPAFIALHGDLGAGKTRFVKGLAAATGLDPDLVVSPTYGLIHVLPLPAGCPVEQIVHADLHRLAGPEDLAEIGWDDATRGAAWVCVEWADRAGPALPADRLEVAIEILSEWARKLTIRALGPRHAAAAAACAPGRGG